MAKYLIESDYANLLIESDIDLYNTEYKCLFNWTGSQYQVLSSHTVGDKIDLNNITSTSNRFLFGYKDTDANKTFNSILDLNKKYISKYLDKAKGFTSTNNFDMLNLTVYRLFDDIKFLRSQVDSSKKVSGILVYDMKVITTFPFISGTKLNSTNYKSLLNNLNTNSGGIKSRGFKVPNDREENFIKPILIINAFTGDFYIDEFNKNESEKTVTHKLLNTYSPYRSGNSITGNYSGQNYLVNTGNRGNRLESVEDIKELIDYGLKSGTGSPKPKASLVSLNKCKGNIKGKKHSKKR